VNTDTKDFRCSSCNAHLCERRGNAIVVGNMEFEFKRSRNILCVKCGAHTPFMVRRDKNTLKENGNSVTR
jgi:hypothetical protein